MKIYMVSLFHRATINYALGIMVVIDNYRMWANAQRDGRPAEYMWQGGLCSTPQSLANAHYQSAVQ